jgi:hypothetical protein
MIRTAYSASATILNFGRRLILFRPIEAAFSSSVKSPGTHETHKANTLVQTISKSVFNTKVIRV